MSLLPLSLQRAQELCEFCPKLCHFACPVSEVTFREALTPWAKVSLAAVSGESPEPSAALAFAGCTGCLRCQQHCAHHNDVPTTLYAARAAAVRAGTAPAAWSALAVRFAAVGHGEPEDLAEVHRALEEGEAAFAVAEPVRTASAASAKTEPAETRALLFAGCDALASQPALVADALSAARALGAPLQLMPAAALCCGLKLVEGGHPELFAAQAARVSAALAEVSARQLVFLSPGCARAVRDRWPAAGVQLRAWAGVEHITSYLLRALLKNPGRARQKLPGAMTFHDPCELARGLVETTAPRALLASALEGGVREPARCAVETSCCGAGGLLPRTLPEVAQAMANARKSELVLCGAPVVTASPGCSRALKADDVVSVVARWLAQSPWKELEP